MNRVAFYFAILLVSTPALAQDHARPRILGIAGVKIASQDWKASRLFIQRFLSAMNRAFGVVTPGSSSSMRSTINTCCSIRIP